MSSRQLRKLQKQRELDQLQSGHVGGEDTSEDEEPIAAPAKPRQSLFAALGGAGDDEEEKTDEEVESLPKEESEPEALPQPAKKGKKKKKKAKNQQAAVREEAQAEKDTGEDEIDRALQELKIERSSTAAASGEATQGRAVDELLQIDTHHLKAINEMRSLFGKEAIDAATQEESEQQAAEMRRLNRQGAQQLNLEQALRGHPKHKLPEISLRRNIFIQGKDYWPRATAAGLTMKEVRKGDDGIVTEFTFHHDKDYDKTQILFFHMVQMGEPMNMVSLLREQPYHITTLLQVSKIATQDQNAALAADLCERALFTFGRVTTSAFRQKLEIGKARLDFKRPENREFWLAGYHYLKSLVRKGTYRTALEWAKLLYSMNPNDPYAMKNFLHPLAMRARQAQWLIDFCASPEHLVGETDDEYMKQTVVLAHLQLGNQDAARKAAVDGMEKLPWLYCALFSELNIDPPPPLWGVKPPGDSQYWTNIYLAQAKDLWDNPAAISTLKEAVKLAQKVDIKDLPKDDPSDLRTARFAFLEGNTKLIGGVPRAILAQQPNYEFDPLPPSLGENIFSSEGVRLPWSDQAEREDGLLQTPQGRAFFERLRRQMERAQQRGAPMPGGDEADFGDPFDMIPDEDDEDLDFDDADDGNFLVDDQRHDALDATRPPEQRRMPGAFSDDDDEPRAGEAGNAQPQGGFRNMLTDLLNSFYGSREPGTQTASDARGMPGGLPADDDDDDNAGSDRRPVEGREGRDG